jgi:hypothetical protein
LQDVQTQLSRTVDVGMEHLTDELDTWRFIGVLLLKMHDEPESAIFERGICGTDNDSVPWDMVSKESPVGEGAASFRVAHTMS